MGPAEGWGGRASPCGQQLQQGRLLGGRLSPLESVPTPGGRQNGTESLDTQAALDTPGVRGCVIRTSATAAHKRREGRKCRTRSTGEDTGSVRSCSQEGPLTGVIQPKAGPGDARERGGRTQGNTRADDERKRPTAEFLSSRSVVSNSSQRTPCSTPGFPVRHRLPDSARVPWASAASHLILYRPLLLTSGSFPVSQFFASGGQSTGASASASVLPMNIQD